MRWLVTGSAGMLGAEAVRHLRGRGADVTSHSRHQLDITSAVAVADAVAGHDVVVNCAAWTAVDAAESEEGPAFLVNAVGPAVLARACRDVGAKLVHVSTDYVFAGDSTEPYAVSDAVSPKSAYGRTKAAGEWAVRAELPFGHLIVRTGWLYGDGNCFPRTIARVARDRGKVDVVTDQVGQPTWTRDVAWFIDQLIEKQAPPGTYHATSSGKGSWYDFAREVCVAAGLGADRVGPTTSAAFPKPAPRPAYSVLGHDEATNVGVPPIPDWRARWVEASGEVLA